MSTDANKKNNNLHEEKKVSDVLIRSMTDRKKIFEKKMTFKQICVDLKSDSWRRD